MHAPSFIRTLDYGLGWVLYYGRQADEAAIVLRQHTTHSLYCMRCHRGTRDMCQHLDDLLAYLHPGRKLAE
jgi:hypothetical protein